jgi:hypothetical protein
MRSVARPRRDTQELYLPPDGQTSQKLVPQGLGLSDGTETSVLDLLSVELQRVLGELEPLGNQSGQLPDPPSLLSEDILGVGGTDDDLGLGVGGSDLTTSVTLLGELSGARDWAKQGRDESPRTCGIV